MLINTQFPIPTIALMLSSLAIACTSEAQPLEPLINTNWAQNSIWDDGKAELAYYEGLRTIYGAPRPHDHTMITVKEEFNRDFYTKADWPYGEKPLLTVLKQNQVSTIPTPNYPYHYMASVFFDRAKVDQGAVKLSLSSQEWCGLTAKEFALHGKVPVQTYMSYWDGQGTGSAPLEIARSGVFFEEELPLLVRTLNFADGANATFNLLENQTTSKVQLQPATTTVELTITAPTTELEIPLGSIEPDDYWTITIEGNNRSLAFQVSREYPNTLLHYSLGNGREYALNELERREYWVIREE